MSSAAAYRIDDQNPWPGLSAFDESAEQFFNGRRNETAELRRLVLNASLTVLFGASGLGKTSLIQAGLFPSSRKEHFLPVYVRLDVRDRKAPIIQQVCAAFQQQISDRRVDAPAFREGESLWEYLHRPTLELWSARNQLLTPMFVFDQFEEVFTLGAENTAAIRQLRIDLADLIENRIPDTLSQSTQGNGASADRLAVDAQRYKVILSFREDFLPSLEGWKRDLPSIARNRFRLLPMSQRRAFDAIHETAPHLVDKKLADDIVRFVAAAREGTDGQASSGDSTEATVEPALLSLVCHGLNEKRKAQNKRKFDEELLKGAKESIIADFYENGVRDLPNHVRDFIGKELITERGFRKQCDVDDARTLYKITDKQLRLLVDRRLLRIEPHQGTDRAELTHDLLTRVVREDRDRSRRWRKRKRIMAYVGVPAALFSIALVSLGRSKYDNLHQRALYADTLARALEAQQQLEKQRVDARAAEKKAMLARAETERASYERKEARKDADRAERARSEMSVQLLASKAALKGMEGDSALPLSMLLAAESLRREPLIDNQAILGKGLLLLPKPLGALPNTSKVDAVAFIPDGTLATSEPGLVRIWNPFSRSPVRQFEVPGMVSAIGVSHDGVFLAVAYGTGNLGNIRVYNLHNGELENERSTTGVATYVSINPNGNITALIGSDLFHWKDWTDTHGALPPDMNIKEMLDSGAAVAISSDHTLLAAYDPEHSKLSIRDFLTGKEMQSWEVGRVPIDDIDFDPSSPKRLVSFDRTGTIRLWSTDSREAYINLQTGPIERVFFSPDGRLLGANASDGTVKIWDTRDGKEVATTAPAQEAAKATALDGLHGLVAFLQGDAVQLAEISDMPLPDLSPIQRVLGITPELRLAAGTCGTSLCVVRFDNNAHSNLINKWKSQTTPTLGSSVTFSADGRFMAGVSRQPVLTRAIQPKTNALPVVWDISTGKQVSIQSSRRNLMILGFTPDRNGLLVGSLDDDQTPTTPENIEIRDVNRSEFNITVPQALQPPPASLAFSADGHWLATSNATSVRSGALAERESEVLYVIRIWHWPDGKVPVRTLEVGTKVSKMAFSSDHRFLVTSAGEAFLRIWDTNTGNEVGRVALFRNGVPLAVAFTDADRRVTAYDRYSLTNSFWRPEDLKREICQRVNRSLTMQEWDEFLPLEKGKYFPTCSAYLHPQ
jgi:WD40 repeat protein